MQQTHLRQSRHWLREGLAIAREDHSSGYLFSFTLLGELAHTTALLGDYPTATTALAEADATKRASSRIYHVICGPLSETASRIGRV